MDDFRNHVSVDAAVNIDKWLTEPKYAEYRDELVKLIESNAYQDLEDAFFKEIEFGTAGRRGVTGVGSNRINRVTIGESAQALCQYANAYDETAPRKGVVIACDTRLSSPELSRYCAQVCAANGFTTYIFDSFRSTPELSFAVRELGAAVGIVISASHNPPTDNGFKAYWSDGGQLVSPHDKGVLAAAGASVEVSAVDYDQASSEGKIIVIGSEIDEKYHTAVLNEAEGSARELTIVYSPLHGAGQTNTLPVLEKAGFDVRPVEAQMVPDGHFPTIDNGKPNPEEKIANSQAVAQMLAMHADIAITNDPDADRIGVIVRQSDTPVYLSGNQSAILATEYSLRKLAEKGTLTDKHYIAKTIVTSDMLYAIAKHYGATVYGDMLIGFKYIGELILAKESTDEVFVIGSEESYGLLKGDYARDKDGAVGALPLAEYAAELKLDGKTLWDRMLELYQEYGLYIERPDTMTCPGAKGFAQMTAIMQSLRESPPAVIGGHTVTAVLDYQSLQRKDLASDEVTSIDCISGNVYALEFGDKRRRLTIRPSGTEPKLKFYSQWYVTTNNPAADYDDWMQKLESMSKELEGMLFDRVNKAQS